MKYLTDGVHLYEVAAVQVVKNAGCYERSGGRHGPEFTVVILRDAVTEAEGRVGDLELQALRELPHAA